MPLGVSMFTISIFYGISVALNYKDNYRHHLPHFHLRDQDFKASMPIEEVVFLLETSRQNNLNWFRLGLSY